MKRDIYEEEILDNWASFDDSREETDRKYEKLSMLLDPMYDFVLAFSNYYNTRRNYGIGPDLTMIEVHILTQIADNPGITVTELAEIWHRSTSAISQTVRKLMKQDLVYRENSKENGKIFNLYTSEFGNELALSHKKYDNIDILKTRKKLLNEFSVEELLAFDKVCKAYTDILWNHTK
ncbi:MarR family transcriptional regulator [Anaerococcus sp. Marseille-Q7828]|uniref:MarR family winged helix-turn-helix transcriptional regulator n=1 Tax=Anaerococcus sp. Marseille-Q7828 TaxID=3036300 RepID=UPI0024AD4BFF|nr:MarR family transcriptional regulator [Anaerococcus sp. Marseille-Q7828]